MKHLLTIITICFLLPVALFATETPKTDAKIGILTILVTGLVSNDGDVKLALFNSEESYTAQNIVPFRKIAVPIKEKKAEIVFDQVPFGTYAIKLFHDADQNGELNINPRGLPEEAYAFSNHADGRHGPPPYEKARFEFNREQMKIEIKMPSEG